MIRAASISALVLLSGCASQPKVVVRTVFIHDPDPFPLPCRTAPVTAPDGPAAIKRGLTDSYSSIQSQVTRSVLSSNRAAPIEHLTALDQQARRALIPIEDKHHRATSVEIKAAVNSLADLKAATQVR